MLNLPHSTWLGSGGTVTKPDISGETLGATPIGVSGTPDWRAVTIPYFVER